MSFNVPVLFIIFNRPEATSKVFNQIRKIKPRSLFISGDGPRDGRPLDGAKVRESRSLVLDGIDWDCEVSTLLHNQNLGCGLAVSKAITWFFEKNEMGIILEDDCFPSLSFFSFCELLLNHYKYDKRIYSIGGTNIFEKWTESGKDYLFSYQGSIWGWASWRRAWDQYRFQIPDALSKESLNALTETSISKEILDLRIKNFKSAEKVDTWDYQWIFTRLVNRGLTILPACNMVTNIGFDQSATHTTDPGSYLSNLQAFEIEKAIQLRDDVVLDYDFEELFTNRIYMQKEATPSPITWPYRLLGKLVRISKQFESRNFNIS